MKIDFSNIALIFFLLFSLQKATGQELNSIAVENKIIYSQSEMVLLINITPSDPNFCGIRIEWGDGEGQGFRYEKPTSEPIKITKIYDKPGDYTVSVKGMFLSRGLKSAGACKGENLTLTIKVGGKKPATVAGKETVAVVGKEPVAVAGKETVAVIGKEPVAVASKKYEIAVLKQMDFFCEKFKYPLLSKLNGEEGLVSLAIAIDSKGKLIAAEINRTSGYKGLDDATLLNIKKNCTFNPKIIDGKPVESIAILNVEFRFEDVSRETPQARRNQYPDTSINKVDEILEVRLREAIESRLIQEKEDAEYQAWLRTSEGKKFLLDQAIQKKKEMAERELEAKKIAEQVRQKRVNIAKEYPYYAIVSCVFSGQLRWTGFCFSGLHNLEKNVEIRNGTSRRMLPFSALGTETNDGLVINLNSNFEIKMINSSEAWLQMRIYDRVTNKLILQRGVGSFGVISVKNCSKKTISNNSNNLPLPKDFVGACDA